MEARPGVQGRKSVVCCWGHVGLRTPFRLPDRPLTHQGHLMGLCDPVVLGTARKSLASFLDIEVLTLNMIRILFSVTWKLPLFIFSVGLAMK